jgi:Holliday junction resolvase RusA-like endonuclease
MSNAITDAVCRFQLAPMGAVRMNQSRASQHSPAAERYTTYKMQLRILARMLSYEVPAAGLSLRFILPMPKSWSAKKQAEMMGQPHQSKPDTDNLIKGFLDALCPDVEGGDSYVWQYGRMEKIWGKTGAIVVLESE